MKNRKTSKIILGTVQFGMDYGINNKNGRPTKEAIWEILNTAHSLGIGILDSAEGYGTALKHIGAYHSAFPKCKFQVISKFIGGINGKNTPLQQRVEETLAMLSSDKLYAYMYHHFELLKAVPKTYEELRELKSKGLIEKMGISLYSNEQLVDVLENYDFDLLQIPFNVLDNLRQRGTLLEKAHNQGLEIHVRSAFLQGLFFMDPNNLPKPLEPLTNVLMEFHNISTESGLSISELCLGYISSIPFIDHIVIGVDNVHQLNQNIRELNKEIPGEVFDRINELDVKATYLLNPSNWQAK